MVKLLNFKYVGNKSEESFSVTRLRKNRERLQAATINKVDLVAMEAEYRYKANKILKHLEI